MVRESENFCGGVKDEQKGAVLEGGRGLRKAVNGHTCQACYVRLLVLPCSHLAIQLLHPFVLCLGLAFHGAFPRRTSVLWALPAAVPSSPCHSSPLTSFFTKQVGLYPATVLSVCVAIKVFLPHCNLTVMLFALDLQFSYLGLHPRRVFTKVLKGPLYEAWTLLE